MSVVQHFYEARGKVQGVMFRNTVINAMKKYEIQGGATNDPSDNSLVKLTMHGEQAQIQSLIERLTNGKPLNDWGALATSVEKVESGMSMDEHQVTTANIDGIKWNNAKVTFYI